MRPTRIRQRCGSRLRPPGARTDEAFLAACVRCGQCVEACPEDILHLAHIDQGLSMGTPFLVAREKPCNLCQGFDTMRCIAAGPSGALEAVARGDVRMGTAVIDHAKCLAWQGTFCRECWHACPFPDEVITFDERARPTVNEAACVGCGLCEHACPTGVLSLGGKARNQLTSRQPCPGEGEATFFL